MTCLNTWLYVLHLTGQQDWPPNLEDSVVGDAVPVRGYQGDDVAKPQDNTLLYHYYPAGWVYGPGSEEPPQQK